MKLGLFFGAGAESSYGLPLGGRFAIELFRRTNTHEKEEFRKRLELVNERSSYATNWLPSNYKRKRIHAFGKSEFRSIIESSIEYRKKKIVEKLNKFDSLAEAAMKNLDLSKETYAGKFLEKTHKAYGEETYSQVIKINALLAENVEIFKSEFYSAVLDLIKLEDESAQLSKYASSVLQLLIGAYGQDLVQKVNQEIFTEAPDDLAIFDDITGMFRLEYDRIGTSALELLLKSDVTQSGVDTNTDIRNMTLAILREIIEILFSEILDYQSLIDSHWRYLYSPSEDWAKFTKMVIFLNSTRHYLKSQLEDVPEKGASGYYHDIQNMRELEHEGSVIGTANYNNLVTKFGGESVAKIQIFHLNGNVDEFYNPYKNTIVKLSEIDSDEKQILVPFMLTQSGIKPLTSISMSRRYVQLYDKYKNCDAIISVGYGFNVDDNHINGLFRQLVEEEKKHLYIITRLGGQTAEEQKREFLEKIRISKKSQNQVSVIQVDGKTRKTKEGKLWLDAVSAPKRQLG